MYLTVKSSINIFWEENKKIRISTANHDLPGFHIEGVNYYPKQRTSKKIETKLCEHEFKFKTLIQLQAADEGANSLEECIKCGKTRLK